MFQLDTIRQRLTGYQHEQFTTGVRTREAAVAIILRELNPGEPEILFIKRAEKAGDPWSGHMAFPGGHKDPLDLDLKHAAIRETLEEIGLDLRPATYLGALDQQRAMPRRRHLDMLIAPFVFELEGDPAFEPNYEVAEVVWTPLQPLATNAIHDTMEWPMAGQPTIFNGYRLATGHFVWGLTYRMLKTFFTALDPDWTGPPEL
ncbi:MAG: CoA pyrophosphatase [Pseudomonadales bacterium]|jgi:8-oxo-dGTP pyrophosphatase MutT (NUDIX family)|nr:CoA pyrophosphatase [Pseudomonadales bacterium]MDP6470321.1 CoA pyrophosphatase [Pseudomonadales bacterium]MDP6827227.1 CoA pyrophosphatase [Pseudomonadales bacterium]MDP6972470.1 CoA pyrophosphatase [Pseudomonadales bacterium]|tara:strand:+ start:3427 stop:4035 length:609 start_codon:yes stop_codon:yes gene_type:complete